MEKSEYISIWQQLKFLEQEINVIHLDTSETAKHFQKYNKEGFSAELTESLDDIRSEISDMKSSIDSLGSLLEELLDSVKTHSVFKHE
jgi:hypothetical protein